MTAHNLNSGTRSREWVSFVPTTFFVEFLAAHKGWRPNRTMTPRATANTV